jgi:hypothetical protein
MDFQRPCRRSVICRRMKDVCSGMLVLVVAIHYAIVIMFVVMMEDVVKVIVMPFNGKGVIVVAKKMLGQWHSGSHACIEQQGGDDQKVNCLMTGIIQL